MESSPTKPLSIAGSSLTPPEEYAAPPGFRTDLRRWRQLVSVEWLAAFLAGETVAAAPAADWLLFDVACDGRDAFLLGHIPGAQYLDTRQFEHLPFWNKVPESDLLRVLQQIGIGPDTTVILCGRNMLAAARVAHLMLVTGVHDVRLLDGGLSAWCAAGHAVRPGPEQARPGTQAIDAHASAGDVGCVRSQGFEAHPEYLIDTTQARALRESVGGAMVSIRTRAEYLGETSGYGYIQARGEVAGALWGTAGSDGDVNSMDNFQDALGRMKPAAEIAALWHQAGIRQDMQIAFYCGTGWRASLAFLYAWLMGWEHISVYDGGWLEWSGDPANPVICRTVWPP